MTDEMRNKLVDAFEDNLRNKGTVIHYKNEYIDLDKDDVEVSMKCNQYFDSHMVVYVIEKMIQHGEIDFKVGKDNKNYQYLCKLLKVGSEMYEDK